MGQDAAQGATGQIADTAFADSKPCRLLPMAVAIVPAKPDSRQGVRVITPPADVAASRGRTERPAQTNWLHLSGHRLACAPKRRNLPGRIRAQSPSPKPDSSELSTVLVGKSVNN